MVKQAENLKKEKEEAELMEQIKVSEEKSKVENENQFESNLICRSDEHNNEKVNSVNKSTYQQK